MIEAWDVFYVWVQQVANGGKNKYVVVVSVDSNKVGVVFINSDLVKNPKLHDCDVLISQGEHPFLDHFCYVSVTGLGATGDLCYLHSNLFTEEARRGVISENFRPTVLEAVRKCPTLVEKTRKLALSCLSQKCN